VVEPRQAMRAKWGCALALCCLPLAAGAAVCPPPGYSQQALSDLRSHGFAVSNDIQRNALALALVPCLAATDPTLRDGIAFDALSTFMRGKQLRAATAISLMDQLVPWLDSQYPDPQGVARPFAVLVLSEVARMDRIDPFLSAAQRHKLLSAGTAYLIGVRDYRGFDATIGWRHGVAHGADLMMQLALNHQVDQVSLKQVIDAVATQIVPRVGKTDVPHFYIYGESQRLARPVFYTAQRQLLSKETWRAWMNGIVSSSLSTQGSDANGSQAGLARRHNTTAFLNALYVLVNESGDADTQSLLMPLVGDALKTPQ